MGDLRQPVDERELERQLSFSHYGGKATAYADAAACLIQNSMGEFADGNDRFAKKLRDYANEFEKRAETARVQQRKYGNLP